MFVIFLWKEQMWLSGCSDLWAFVVVQCSVVMVPRNMGEDHGRHNSVVTPKKKKENKHGGFLSFFFFVCFFLNSITSKYSGDFSTLYQSSCTSVIKLHSTLLHYRAQWLWLQVWVFGSTKRPLLLMHVKRQRMNETTAKMLHVWFKLKDSAPKKQISQNQYNWQKKIKNRNI